MNLFNSTAKTVLSLLFFVILTSAVGACIPVIEPALDITVHNQTNETLQIFFGAADIGQVAPGSNIKFTTGANLPFYDIIAKDTNGNIVYSVNFTQDDLKGKRRYDVYFPPR